MGLFGFGNWNKPGPGVRKDEPKKRGPFRFFVVVGRKFWQMVQLNLIYVFASVIQIALLYFLFGFFASNLAGPLIGEFTDAQITETVMFLAVSMLIFFLSMCGAGPTTAGLCFVMKNWSEESHAFVWSDFKEKTLENMKQGIVVFLVDVLILILFACGMFFYTSIMHGLFADFLRMFLIICYALYLMMHWYIYPLMVFYEVKTYQLFVNSFLLVMLKLPENILLLLITGGLLIGYFTLCTVFSTLLVLAVFLVIAFVWMIHIFHAWSVVKANVHPTSMKKQPK